MDAEKAIAWVLILPVTMLALLRWCRGPPRRWLDCLVAYSWLATDATVTTAISAIERTPGGWRCSIAKAELASVAHQQSAASEPVHAGSSGRTATATSAPPFMRAPTCLRGCLLHGRGERLILRSGPQCRACPPPRAVKTPASWVSVTVAIMGCGGKDCDWVLILPCPGEDIRSTRAAASRARGG
jgi:hypothetical protein